MRSILLCFAMFFSFTSSNAQQIQLHIVDSKTNEPLIAASVGIKSKGIGWTTDINGNVTIDTSGHSNSTLSINLIGFQETRLIINQKLVSPVLVKLISSELEIQEVVVSTTRTNARIEEQAQKVEVLGKDEMDEESTLVPGNIASLLGDLAGLQVQQTSAVTGNNTIRIQGLDGKYTQFRRDGLPVQDGITSGLGLLDIPPLDLKQVEIIKGPSSTFFGGGAIAGLINFISREPEDSLYVSGIYNVTSFREQNIAAFASHKNSNNGFTLLISGTIRPAYDANGDLFSDQPETNLYMWHPQWLHYFKAESSLRIGYTGSHSIITGGTINTGNKYELNENRYIEKNTLNRNQFDLIYTGKQNKKILFSAKGLINYANRNTSIPGGNFQSKETLAYAEIMWATKLQKHTITAGNTSTLNDNIRKENFYQTLEKKTDQFVTGLFIQDNIQINSRYIVQGGIRADFDLKKIFILPSFSFSQHWNDHLSSRIVSGFGYRLPNEFNEAIITESANSVVINGLREERSVGFNGDITYHQLIGKFSITINQAFFYDQIRHGVLSEFYNGTTLLTNLTVPIKAQGTESYIRCKLEPFELYLGYTYTLNQKDNIWQYYSPKHKIATTLVTELDEKWKAGIEASFTASQKRFDETKTPSWWFAALMVHRKVGHFTITANAENVFDFRQSQFEKIVDQSTNTPQFSFLWGPTTGRVINVALKYVL